MTLEHEIMHIRDLIQLALYEEHNNTFETTIFALKEVKSNLDLLLFGLEIKLLKALENKKEK